MTVELGLLISVVSAACAILFSWRNNRRSDIKDIEERVRRDTIVNTKLDDISLNVKNIRDDVSTMRVDMQNMDKRLVIVEQSTKSAHKRLDRLDGSPERED